MGAKNEKGYGVVGKGRRGEGTTKSHIMSWYLKHGRYPNMCVLHKCDNPCCVKPSHLFLGTRADNNRDMWLKGRGKIPHWTGINNPRARKITYKGITKCLVEWSRQYGLTRERLAYLLNKGVDFEKAIQSVR